MSDPYSKAYSTVVGLLLITQPYQQCTPSSDISAFDEPGTRFVPVRDWSELQEGGVEAVGVAGTVRTGRASDRTTSATCGPTAGRDGADIYVICTSGASRN